MGKWISALYSRHGGDHNIIGIRRYHLNIQLSKKEKKRNDC